MIPDVYDVLLGLSEGRYTLQQAIGWIEIHINDQKDEQQFQEQQRRREMFEKVALTYLTNETSLTQGFEKACSEEVELILSAADKFARGEE